MRSQQQKGLGFFKYIILPTLLVLLDLSAAFDTVNHEILLRRLETTFGITGTALQWFSSYLGNRSQRVVFGDGVSESFCLPWTPALYSVRQ